MLMMLGRDWGVLFNLSIKQEYRYFDACFSINAIIYRAKIKQKILYFILIYYFIFYIKFYILKILQEII